MEDDELGKSLIAVLGDAGAKELLIEASEFSLDAVLDDGLVKDVPLIGTVAKLFSVGLAWQGHLFNKKIKRFMRELRDINEAERLEFATTIARDDKQEKRVGETLAVILERLDDMRKPPLLARAFAGYVRGDYDLAMFQRLAVAVDRCFVADLELLRALERADNLPGYKGEILAGAGLAEVVSTASIRPADTNRQFVRHQSKYQRTALGDLFLRVILERQPYTGPWSQFSAGEPPPGRRL